MTETTTRISDEQLNAWEAIDDAFAAQATGQGMVVSDTTYKLIRELRVARAALLTCERVLRAGLALHDRGGLVSAIRNHADFGPVERMAWETAADEARAALPDQEPASAS